jgi:hypothetical protein
MDRELRNLGYAWGGEPVWANLTNKEGLPAVTFRTDDWPKP